ncbi:MAG: hypothetical protein ACKVJ7_06150 [Candidatus Poseidoniales archaeon]|mgnify:CR=1 FL=1|jgi:hypothetical protein
MGEGSVNVESLTSSQDKRWTIMAALLGTNTALMLFQGIEQESRPSIHRELALTIIAAALPFQGLFFMIYTFLLEQSDTASKRQVLLLQRVSALCQVVSYLSLSGAFLLWYNLSEYIGIAFLLSTIIAIIIIRLVMQPVDESNTD